ncbi:hypothetical protein IAT38_004483 [Cryptococcus sp. DSM 104549]
MREVYEGEAPSESSRAPRVNQVDADELDGALVSMLSEKVGRSLDNFRSSVSVDLKPEVELAIKLLIFRFGVWDPSSRSSPGAKLQNLKLISSRSSTNSSSPTRQTLLLYLLLHPPIFPSYLLKRIRQHALSQQWPDLPNHDWRKKAWRALGRVETAARVWEVAGWGWFLVDGRYPSLLMRILGLRLVPSQAHLTKLVSYEFMNRQLVWSAFTEFLLFAIPLLPRLPPSLLPSNLFAPIKSLLSQPKPIDYDSLPLVPPSTSGTPEKSEEHKHTGPLAHLPKATCPVCYLRVSSAPVALDSAGQGSGMMLPAIPGSGEGAFGHGEASLGEEGEGGGDEDDTKEECRVYVPAETDCEGKCRWCYYCIGEELLKHREKIAKARKTGKAEEGTGHGKGKEEAAEEEKEEKWSCLRCGGGVSRARRVGAESDV